jgi:hypothetical protein
MSKNLTRYWGVQVKSGLGTRLGLHKSKPGWILGYTSPIRFRHRGTGVQTGPGTRMQETKPGSGLECRSPNGARHQNVGVQTRLDTRMWESKPGLPIEFGRPNRAGHWDTGIQTGVGTRVQSPNQPRHKDTRFGHYAASRCHHILHNV